MRIAVYSGSFNPLHIGHLAVMRSLTSKDGPLGGRRFDWVYLVVSPKNPLKDSVSADSGEERFKAAVEAVRRHRELKVKVDDIELGMSLPNYTVKTLDKLREREPENEFTLVIGADNLACIRHWKDYGRILSEYGVAVYPRTGFDLEKIRNGLMEESGGTFKIEIIDAPFVDISSSEIRQAKASGQDLSAWLM